MSELVERFTKDLAVVCWKDLRIHLQRDVIITLADGLDMVTAATAVARDDKPQVEAWIAAGQLGKPTADQLESWEQEPDKPFRMLIVQPFILVQAIAHA
jgi:hypothetical protein